ncbi:MAG: tyrosine-type recombinase/integrase, partial [Bacteroidota bacterium]
NQPKAKPIQIKLTEQIQQLVDELQKFKTPLNDYMLPIVTIEHKDEKLYTHIVNKRKRYGNYLKDLAAEFEFEFNLTSYVSRHTMAMQLQNNSISRDKISQILGHSDLQTTNVYLDSLDSSVIDEAVKVL